MIHTRIHLSILVTLSIFVSGPGFDQVIWPAQHPWRQCMGAGTLLFEKSKIFWVRTPRVPILNIFTVSLCQGTSGLFEYRHDPALRLDAHEHVVSAAVSACGRAFQWQQVQDVQQLSSIRCGCNLCLLTLVYLRYTACCTNAHHAIAYWTLTIMHRTALKSSCL